MAKCRITVLQPGENENINEICDAEALLTACPFHDYDLLDLLDGRAQQPAPGCLCTEVCNQMLLRVYSAGRCGSVVRGQTLTGGTTIVCRSFDGAAVAFLLERRD
jgi:hypothetical protein